MIISFHRLNLRKSSNDNIVITNLSFHTKKNYFCILRKVTVLYVQFACAVLEVSTSKDIFFKYFSFICNIWFGLKNNFLSLGVARFSDLQTQHIHYIKLLHTVIIARNRTTNQYTHRIPESI